MTLLFGVSLIIFMACSPTSENPLETIMASQAPEIKRITDNLDKHEVQILYTQIDRDEKGNPVFTEFNFQLDRMTYFYPASTAKLPAAILALQKINEINQSDETNNLSKDYAFQVLDDTTSWTTYDSTKLPEGYPWPHIPDATHKEGHVTIAHMIKKIFLVSDNEAYNHLFEFLGRDYINEELRKRNVGPAHINHKFQAGADNKNMRGFLFFHNDTYLVSKGHTSEVDRHDYPLKKMIKGVGYTDNEGKLYNEPFDFAEKNYFSLKSLNQVLKAVIFPETLPANQRFDLTEEDYAFLRHWMSRTALESEYPDYNDGEHWDSYVKFLMYGDTKAPMPKNIRIYNKIGMAYGTLTDVAYIHDSENDIEFMLAATVQVNENQIFNDGIYEYDELGLPFMAELGRQIYAFEQKRKRSAH